MNSPESGVTKRPAFRVIVTRPVRSVVDASNAVANRSASWKAMNRVELDRAERQADQTETEEHYGPSCSGKMHTPPHTERIGWLLTALEQADTPTLHSDGRKTLLLATKSVHRFEIVGDGWKTAIWPPLSDHRCYGLRLRPRRRRLGRRLRGDLLGLAHRRPLQRVGERPDIGAGRRLKDVRRHALTAGEPAVGAKHHRDVT
jgi:hypothetical protein